MAWKRRRPNWLVWSKVRQVNILFIASKIDVSFRSLPGLDGSGWSKDSSLHSRAIRKSEWLSVLFRIRPGESRLRGRKTIPRSDLIMAALPIRTKPHLPERASKLQDISTEFFQGHRPC